MYNVQCKIYNVQFTMYVYTVQCTLYTVQYTVIIAKVREVRENSTSIPYNALF